MLLIFGHNCNEITIWRTFTLDPSKRIFSNAHQNSDFKLPFFLATWRDLKAIHVNLRVKSFAFYIRRIFLFKDLYGQYSKSKWFTESFSLDYIFGVIRKHKNRMSKQFEIFEVFRIDAEITLKSVSEKWKLLLTTTNNWLGNSSNDNEIKLQNVYLWTPANFSGGMAWQ